MITKKLEILKEKEYKIKKLGLIIEYNESLLEYLNKKVHLILLMLNTLIFIFSFVVVDYLISNGFHLVLSISTFTMTIIMTIMFQETLASVLLIIKKKNLERKEKSLLKTLFYYIIAYLFTICLLYSVFSLDIYSLKNIILFNLGFNTITSLFLLVLVKINKVKINKLEKNRTKLIEERRFNYTSYNTEIFKITNDKDIYKIYEEPESEIRNKIILKIEETINKKDLIIKFLKENKNIIETI